MTLACVGRQGRGVIAGVKLVGLLAAGLQHRVELLAEGPALLAVALNKVGRSDVAEPETNHLAFSRGDRQADNGPLPSCPSVPGFTASVRPSTT